MHNVDPGKGMKVKENSVHLPGDPCYEHIRPFTFIELQLAIHELLKSIHFFD